MLSGCSESLLQRFPFHAAQLTPRGAESHTALLIVFNIPLKGGVTLDTSRVAWMHERNSAALTCKQSAH